MNTPNFGARMGTGMEVCYKRRATRRANAEPPLTTIREEARTMADSDDTLSPQFLKLQRGNRLWGWVRDPRPAARAHAEQYGSRWIYVATYEVWRERSTDDG